MTTAVVLFADGSEEMEAVTIVNLLRRAGITVTIAAVGSSVLTLTGSQRTVIEAEALLGDLPNTPWDIVILPGGTRGAEVISANPEAIDFIRAQQKAERWLAAICASPVVVLHTHDLIPEGVPFTAYPSLLTDLGDEANPVFEKVVVAQDAKLITGMGPYQATDFSLGIIEVLLGEETKLRVAKGILYPEYVA